MANYEKTFSWRHLVKIGQICANRVEKPGGGLVKGPYSLCQVTLLMIWKLIVMHNRKINLTCNSREDSTSIDGVIIEVTELFKM